jgi:hypothetical protein
MRSRLLKAALSIVWLTTSVWAQRGGVSAGHAGFQGHPGFSRGAPLVAGRSAARGFAGTTSRGAPFRGGFGTRFGFHHRFFHNRFHRRFFAGFPGWWYYPYLGYPGYYDYPSYNQDASYDDARISEDLHAELQQERYDIDRLRDEIERLSEQRQPAPKTELKEPKDDIHSLTVLVFRDKHTEEVQNYAIIGQTLWILNEARARKVPLADMDVPATIKANDERGTDFKVPR